MIWKLDMQHRELEVSKFFFIINDDPGLTLTHFTARSNLAAYVFDWKNCYKVNQKGKKNLQQMTKLTEN